MKVWVTLDWEMEASILNKKGISRCRRASIRGNIGAAQGRQAKGVNHRKTLRV